MGEEDDDEQVMLPGEVEAALTSTAAPPSGGDDTYLPPAGMSYMQMLLGDWEDFDEAAATLQHQEGADVAVPPRTSLAGAMFGREPGYSVAQMVAGMFQQQ